MFKKTVSALCISVLALVFTTQAFGFGSGALEPKVDLDLVVLQDNHSVTVTADLTGTSDFGIIPVALIGSGTFTASLSKTNTNGEIVFLFSQGFGVPRMDINVGVTPITIRVSSTVSDQDDYAIGVIIHGLPFSAEDPPHEYNISLSY
jgi:hypothetical protein